MGKTEEKMMQQEQSYSIRIGADMPMRVCWTEDYGAWREEGERNARAVAEMLRKRRRTVYLIGADGGAEVEVLRCEPVAQRIAYRLVVERQGVRSGSGGVVVDERAEVYDGGVGRWRGVSEMAGKPEEPLCLVSRRCLSDMYELELAGRAEVCVVGQMMAPFGKLEATELPQEMLRRAAKYTAAPFWLRPTQTGPATRRRKEGGSYMLIGIIPLCDHRKAHACSRNMSLYRVWEWAVRGILRCWHPTEAYYLYPTECGIASQGALAFCVQGLRRGYNPIYFSARLNSLVSQVKELRLAPALHLYTTNAEGSEWRYNCKEFTAEPVQPCRENPLHLLETLPKRPLFTEPRPISCRSHVELQAARQPGLHFGPSVYARIFSPTEDRERLRKRCIAEFHQRSRRNAKMYDQRKKGLKDKK